MLFMALISKTMRKPLRILGNQLGGLFIPNQNYLFDPLAISTIVMIERTIVIIS